MSTNRLGKSIMEAWDMRERWGHGIGTEENRDQQGAEDIKGIFMARHKSVRESAASDAEAFVECQTLCGDTRPHIWGCAWGKSKGEAVHRWGSTCGRQV